MKYTVLISFADYEDFEAKDENELDEKICDWLNGLTGEEAKQLLMQSNTDYQVIK